MVDFTSISQFPPRMEGTGWLDMTRIDLSKISEALIKPQLVRLWLNSFSSEYRSY
jgi:hypothetical protein